MSPLEAYEALMLFARRRGEGALRLAMHAAVPQSFRPDLLHLLKLNFLPRELHDPAAEADVLFSPLCEEAGPGYFEFGPHVRTLLLDNLAANYAADRTPRIERVANFLLFYVEHMERRAAGGLDRLWHDYLEVQRWVALAFLDSDDAARQLATALKGGTATGEFAARLRLGGLATALSSPLVKYRHVLNYAAGLQALEAGDHERAHTLLSGLGDAEIEVGGVRLRPATDLLRDYHVQRPEPAPSPETASTHEPPQAPRTGARIFLGHTHKDRERVVEAYERLKTLGHEPWAAFASIRAGERWDEAIEAAMKRADFFIFFLSRNVFQNSYLKEEIKYALGRAQERPEEDIFILPARLEPCEIPPELAQYSAVDLSSEEGWKSLEEALDWFIKPTTPRSEAEEREEKLKAFEALAGSDDPHALETLTEAVWHDDDSRARLAAVNALRTSMHRDGDASLNDLRNLRRSRLEAAREALLVAAGDEEAEVRRAAADALAGAEINAVLIFGFFGTDHVENLEVLREELRRRGYVPLLFPFARPPVRNTADIIRAAAPITHFAVADLTAPREIEQDLAIILEQFLSQSSALLVPIHQGVMLSKLPLDLRRKYNSVLALATYANPSELREAFDRAVMEPLMNRQRSTEKGGEADDFYSLYKDASSLEAAGHFEQALAGYERAQSAAESEAHQLEARKARTDLLEKMGRFEEVLRLYEQKIELTPDDEELHLGRSRMLERLGMYAEAVSSYETTASIAGSNSGVFNPTLRRALLGRGRCLIKLGLYREAIALLTETRPSMEEHGHPSDVAELLTYMGQAFTGLLSFDEARHHYEQSLTTYRRVGERRGEVEALNGLGHLMQSAGDVEGAVSALRESLRILTELKDDRGAAAVFVNLGRVFTAAGLYEDGHEALTQALSISSQAEDKDGEVASLVGLGALYSQSRRLTEALDAYQKALAISPDSVDAVAGRDEVMKKMSA